jgi:CRISPR/Cas system endoribonuclease Cas6 (RAMP superfamily)
MLEKNRGMSVGMGEIRAAGFGLMAAAAFLVFSGCGGAAATGTDDSAGGPGELVVPARAGMRVNALEHYGPLIVDDTASDGIYAQADTQPWSGYWYPISDDVMVNDSNRNGNASTLGKYDKYSAKQFGHNSTSIDYEKKSGGYVQSDEIGSAGRCHAWALASVLEPEPKLPPQGVSIGGQTFYTRDVKALMIKSYERIEAGAPIVIFGEPFDPLPNRAHPAANDYNDVYPEQFHRVLQAELFEKHRPILMDSDATDVSWNKPIWRANITMQRDSADNRIMHVKTEVIAAITETVSVDFVGTMDKYFDYTYDLYGDVQPDGSLNVKYGKWTGGSADYHPDFITALPPKGTKLKHASFNTQLEQSVIDDIFAKSGALKH